MQKLLTEAERDIALEIRRRELEHLLQIEASVFLTTRLEAKIKTFIGEEASSCSLHWLLHSKREIINEWKDKYPQLNSPKYDFDLSMTDGIVTLTPSLDFAKLSEGRADVTLFKTKSWMLSLNNSFLNVSMCC